MAAQYFQIPKSQKRDLKLIALLDKESIEKIRLKLVEISSDSKHSPSSNKLRDL